MDLALRRARMILLLLLAASSAAARAPAVLDLTVDPRFELLGIVRHLAGRGPANAASADYLERVAKRFGPLRDHPAVALYKDLAASPSREEAAATILIHYTDPPGLALKDPDADVHYVSGPGEAAEMQRFLHELRAFARASDFIGFFRDNRRHYGKLEASARASFGDLDPIAEIESYAGLSLAARSRYLLPALYAETHAFIVPYPLPPANPGAMSFTVYSVSSDFASGSFTNALWHEPLFVLVDPSFYYFEKINIPVPEDFYGAEVARCRAVSPDCVKNFAVAALVEHLNRKAGIPLNSGAPLHEPSPLESRLIKALSARLDEYDASRDRYPTLWDFYPRWLAVFEEEAFPGRPPRKLAVPAAPKIKSMADFFDPATRKSLLEARAR